MLQSFEDPNILLGCKRVSSSQMRNDILQSSSKLSPHLVELMFSLCEGFKARGHEFGKIPKTYSPILCVACGVQQGAFSMASDIS